MFNKTKNVSSIAKYRKVTPVTKFANVKGCSICGTSPYVNTMLYEIIIVRNSRLVRSDTYLLMSFLPQT